MNINSLRELVRKPVSEHSSKPCKKGDKRAKCRRKKQSYYSPFPILFPSSMGTPRTFTPGSADGNGGEMGGGSNGGEMGGGEMGEEERVPLSVRPSRARVLHEMKKSLGLLENSPNAPNPSWGGFSIPQFGMTKMRKGGPTIGGPGFTYNVDGEEDGKGGIYDLRKSPGIGFRTEYAWRIWDAAIDVMMRDKTLTKRQVVLQAMQRAGVHHGQIDPAELRLVDMGVEWYLTDPNQTAASRGIGGTNSGGTLAGRSAP